MWVKWVCKTDFDDRFALHLTAAAVRQRTAQRHEKSKVCILQAKHGYRGIGIWGKQIWHQILAMKHRCRTTAANDTTPSKYKIKELRAQNIVIGVLTCDNFKFYI